MWYPKLWLVVRPTVGLPIFFTAVAVASLIVHIGVLTHTTWFPAFLEGNQHVAKAAAMRTSAAAPAEAPAAPAAAANPSVVINVGPSGVSVAK